MGTGPRTQERQPNASRQRTTLRGDADAERQAPEAIVVLIVGGTPGAGKTAVARQLAVQNESGVHLESDWFFRFLAHKLDPSLPESQSQNETVVRAYVEAARAYSAGGYAVYLDGVIGPWLFPLILPILPTFDYVILHASEGVVLDRTRRRSTQASAKPGVVMRMHREFQKVLAGFEAHVVVTDDMSVADVAAEVESRQSRGVLGVGGG